MSSESDRNAKMEQLLRRLVDIDWCIGYEILVHQMIELDDIRTEAYELLEGLVNPPPPF